MPFDLTGVIIAGIGSGGTLAAAFLLFRGKNRDVTQASTEWIVKTLNEYAKEQEVKTELAEAKAETANQKATEALKTLASCEAGRQLDRKENRILVLSLQAQITNLRTEVDLLKAPDRSAGERTRSTDPDAGSIPG